jgi:hypothetical protein
LAITSDTGGKKTKGSASNGRKGGKIERSTGVRKAEGGLRSLVKSQLFRNVVAAGLAAAAAALVSKASSSSDDAERPVPDGPLDGSNRKARSPSLTAKVRRKTKTAKSAVAKAAESVGAADAGAKLTRKARKAAKATKSALTGADGEKEASGRSQSTDPRVQQRSRKIRSDAGSRRKPRENVPDLEAPLSGDLPNQPHTETSALALSTATIPSSDKQLQLAEVQSTEAQPG